MKRNFFDWMANRTDLITEAVPGRSLVEMAGDRRVLVENHRGVTQYGRKEIRVRVSYGMICVHGSCLELAQMTKEKLVITGCVEGISLFRGVC